MKRFPNKMIRSVYEAAIGKTFTHRPHAQEFIDENGNSGYDYRVMLWLRDHGVLKESKPSGSNFTYKYRIT